MVTVISLFAGCGGSSLGYKYAGYKELLAIEWDDNAVEAFKLNFPEVPIWKRDIRKVKGQEILDFLNIKKGELDLLDGSPPCQGFSTAGKRQVIDKRNDLINENIRLIEELEPRVFVIENVSGMIKGKMKGLFIEYIKKMKSLNYQVKCKLMNAKYYNVPQSRQRVIFIGVRKDLGTEPSYPRGNKKVITVREAFKDIEGKQNHHPKFLPKNTQSYKNWFKAKGTQIPVLGQSLYRLELDKPSFTVKKSSEHFHPLKPRRLTIREYLRLFSFPDTYIVKIKSHENIGNAVPPLFMEAIAEHIRINILEKAVKLN